MDAADPGESRSGSSGEQAGGCDQLIPVAWAIGRGFYGAWTPDALSAFMLTQIFPQGVCDYSKPDAGLPPEW